MTACHAVVLPRLSVSAQTDFISPVKEVRKGASNSLTKRILLDVSEVMEAL